MKTLKWNILLVCVLVGMATVSFGQYGPNYGQPYPNGNGYNQPYPNGNGYGQGYPNPNYPNGYGQSYPNGYGQTYPNGYAYDQYGRPYPIQPPVVIAPPRVIIAPPPVFVGPPVVIRPYANYGYGNRGGYGGGRGGYGYGRGGHGGRRW